MGKIKDTVILGSNIAVSTQLSDNTIGQDGYNNCILIGSDIEPIDGDATNGPEIILGNAIYGQIGTHDARGTNDADITIDGDLTVAGDLTATVPGTWETNDSHFGFGTGITLPTTTTSPENSVVIGTNAGSNVASDSTNIAIGQFSFTGYTQADINVVIGQYALTASSSPKNTFGNIAIGSRASLNINEAQGNIAIGKNAGAGFGNTSRRITKYNVILGDLAANRISHAEFNVMIGNNVAVNQELGNGTQPYEKSILIGDNVEAIDNTGASGPELNIGSAIYGTLGTHDTRDTNDADLTIDGDMQIGTSSGKGAILVAPDGGKWRLEVDNSGNLSTSSV
jgi:hypothetical protein